MIEWLPSVNAFFNGACFVCLSAGRVAIARQQREQHRRWMLGALSMSALFLIGYLTRIFLSGTHRFPELGWIKTLYLIILLTHSVLAAINLPLILRAVILALQKRFEDHARVVRFAWPIWMYVSLTGVIVYLMLYHLAPSLAPVSKLSLSQ